jgi:hypothetical protein
MTSTAPAPATIATLAADAIRAALDGGAQYAAVDRAVYAHSPHDDFARDELVTAVDTLLRTGHVTVTPADAPDPAALLAEMTRCRDNALADLYRDDVETDPHLPSVAADAITGMGFDWDDDRVVQDIADTVASALQPAFGKLTQERDRLRIERDRLLAFANWTVRNTRPLTDIHTAALTAIDSPSTRAALVDLAAIAAEIAAPACTCHAEPVHQAGCPAA